METAAEAIAYIHGRNKWKKTPSFERIEALLAQLGHPEQASQFIHVTGTNGKGSTSKILAQVLRAVGLRVGLFTSPFIMTFNERIQDEQGNIPDADLLAIMQQIQPIADELDNRLADGGPTEFETLTAMMFMYFAQHPVDVVILEVGVGGTWDSTQVIKDKLAAVITTVGLDHTHVLGETLAEIATNKAGIVQRQRPVITGTLPFEAAAVVQTVAAAAGARVYQLGRDFQVTPFSGDAAGERFAVHGTIDFADLTISLQGRYQIDNAAVALQTAALVLPVFNRQLTATIAHTGLEQVVWPVRFEQIAAQPTIILDGAHNLHGVSALAETIASRYTKQRVFVLFSALADKNYPAMLQKLADLSNVQVSVVGFQAPGHRSEMDLQAASKAVIGQPVAVYDDWQAGYAVLQTQVTPDDVIIFTGSLYFVSEVRAALI